MTKSTMETTALEMSDEDFLKNPNQFDQAETEDTEDTTDTEEEADTTEDEVGEDSGSEDDVADPTDTGTVKDKPDTEEEPVKEEVKQENQSTEGLTDSDYAEIGRQVMSEFKANGSTMKVKSVDDALQLMQMGANYHKKMTGLKPSLKTLKLLENNGLLDPDKLNYLIDLSQKKPEAIKQLLKDSKLDPLEMDLEEETNYKPHNRTVSDTEMALDEVLDSISSSPLYDRTLNILSNEWDDASRKVIAGNPELIGTINMHLENGIYDQVASAVAYERSLGKLTGISDLEAYQRVGAYMNENNLFKGSNVQQSTQGNQERQVQQPQNSQSTQQDEERKNRKKAVSPSRQGPVTSRKDDNYNPLEMSDEEFAKLNNLSL